MKQNKKAISLMCVGLRVTNGNTPTERHSSPTYRGWVMNA